MKWQITYDNDDINQIIDYCVDNFQYYFDKIEHEFTPSDKIDDVIHNYSTNIAHDCFKSLVQDCIQNSLSQFSKQEKDFLETIHSWNDYELSKESNLNPNNFDRYAKQNSNRYYEVLQNYVIGYRHGNTDEILRKCYTNYDELFNGNDPYNKVLEVVADKFAELNKKFHDKINFDNFIEKNLPTIADKTIKDNFFLNLNYISEKLNITLDEKAQLLYDTFLNQSDSSYTINTFTENAIFITKEKGSDTALAKEEFFNSIERLGYEVALLKNLKKNDGCYDQPHYDFAITTNSTEMKNLLDYLKEQKCYELEKITDYSAHLKDEFNKKDQNINTRRYK